jgi:NAD-dependent dihydropyrimidine dehydrogenase PreA subunit
VTEVDRASEVVGQRLRERGRRMGFSTRLQKVEHRHFGDDNRNTGTLDARSPGNQRIAAGTGAALFGGMAYVITEPCVSTCDTACVKVCPVNCIDGPVTPEELDALSTDDRRRRVDRLQLFIDPQVCICCHACEPVCPVNAIFDESDVPAKWEGYIARNADYFAKP